MITDKNLHVNSYLAIMSMSLDSSDINLLQFMKYFEFDSPCRNSIWNSIWITKNMCMSLEKKKKLLAIIQLPPRNQLINKPKIFKIL